MSAPSLMRYRFLFNFLLTVFILTLISQRSTLRDAFPPHVGKNTNKASQPTILTSNPSPPKNYAIHDDAALAQNLHTVSTKSTYFTDYPLLASEFGKMGKRMQVLRDWIEASNRLSDQMSAKDASSLWECIDETALSLFP